MEFVGWPRQRIAEALNAYADFFDVRVILVDGGQQVVFDSDDADSMIGETFAVPAGEPGRAGDGTTFVSDRVTHGDRDLFVFALSGEPPAVVSRLLPTSEFSLVVAVPATDVTDAWARLLPRLLFAGGIAALFAAVVGSWLASRITRPIVQMTHASRAMARGDYDQRIDVRGDDEVSNLARAFNQMATRVARSNRAQRQLLADVSHELKTPLTSIQGFSQALVDGVVDDPEETKRLAEVVHEEAERMRELVDDLLYLSRIESGELPLSLDRVELDGLVAASERRLRYQAEASAVRVRLELAGGAVLGDERRLEQVFANLLDNAIRFSPECSQVQARTRRHGDAVVVEVHNEGEPIPEDEIEHIFGRFYQVDRARTGSGHSGLGLAIVSELVQAHGGGGGAHGGGARGGAHGGAHGGRTGGGTVSVRSTREEGTVFSVRLPQHGSAAAAALQREDA